MDRFQSLQAFVKVAEYKSFSAAARQLNMSPPAVTRAISLLEDRLGLRLFVRTTRSVRLQESALAFLEEAKRILQDLDRAERNLTGAQEAPQGELTLTAPVLFGAQYVSPVLAQFLKNYPKVQVQTLFVDRIVNMMEEGIDIAVRIGDLPDSSLRAVRAGEIKKVTFGSKAYLDEYGRPDTLDDLKKHILIQPLNMGRLDKWAFYQNGRKITQTINPRAIMNTNDAVLSMVRAGCGLSQLLSYQVAPDLQKGVFERVLTDYEGAAFPIHILHSEGRLVSSKVRHCVDYLVEAFRKDPNLSRIITS